MKYIIKEESPFLGTMAGTSARISSHESNYQQTEGRVYKDDKSGFTTYGVPIATIREKIAATEKMFGDGLNVGTRFQSVGDKHHDNGIYFKTIYICNKYDNPGQGPMDNCFSYALSTFGSKLEKVAKKPMQNIVASVSSSIDKAVKDYFEPVIDCAKDGDLVVYQSQYYHVLTNGGSIDPGSNTHAGIYRDTKSNGYSPNGGTVESKWGWMSNPFVFQHDMFVVPPCYGDIVKFYRLKSESGPEEVFLQDDLSLSGQIVIDC